jgi:predicted small lipoprotein YifL
VISSVRKQLLAALAIAATLALAGCGQKGNLYLPNQKKKVPAPVAGPDQTPQPSAAPLPAAPPAAPPPPGPQAP